MNNHSGLSSPRPTPALELRIQVASPTGKVLVRIKACIPGDNFASYSIIIHWGDLTTFSLSRKTTLSGLLGCGLQTDGQG